MPKAKKGDSIGRRTFLTAVGASAGAVALAKVTKASAQRARASSPGASPAVAGGAPAIFAGLHAGARIDRWAVVKVHAVKLGAVPVVLVGEDRLPFQVDVLRRDPSSGAVGRSRSLAVYVANGGNGARQTNEDHGLAAMALAAYLGEREQAGEPVPELLTHAERTARHPRGVFSVFE